MDFRVAVKWEGSRFVAPAQAGAQFPMKTILALLLLFSTATFAQDLSRVKLPPGFAIEVFATGVKDARSMALGDKGTLFVGTRTDGRVYAIRNDGKKAS